MLGPPFAVSPAVTDARLLVVLAPLLQSLFRRPPVKGWPWPGIEPVFQTPRSIAPDVTRSLVLIGAVRGKPFRPLGRLPVF